MTALLLADLLCVTAVSMTMAFLLLKSRSIAAFCEKYGASYQYTAEKQAE